jgi:hypothetical protein
MPRLVPRPSGYRRCPVKHSAVHIEPGRLNVE